MKGNFDSIITADIPVLVDFKAEWCGPCKVQAPILKEIAVNYKQKLRVIKIDVDKNPSIAQRYAIRSIPTLVLFYKGKILWQKSGLISKAELSNVIDMHLK